MIRSQIPRRLVLTNQEIFGSSSSLPSLCNLFYWVLYVYLLLLMYICRPWRCIKFALRICVGDCLRFLLYVRDLSFARDRSFRFLPRTIICQFLNARNGFRADIHLGYLSLMPLCW